MGNYEINNTSVHTEDVEQEQSLYECMEAMFYDFVATDFVSRLKQFNEPASIRIVTDIPNEVISLEFVSGDMHIATLGSIDFCEVNTIACKRLAVTAECIATVACDRAYGEANNPIRQANLRLSSQICSMYERLR